MIRTESNLDPPEIAFVHLWYLLAACVGALGSQTLYWRDPRRRLARRTVLTAAAAFVTGCGVGFFVGVTTEPFVGRVAYLLSLGSAFYWHDTIKSVDAARQVGAIVSGRVRLLLAGGQSGSPPNPPSDGR